LVLAEVELASAQEDLHIPPWCGEEITGESRWSNAVLAQHPVQSWPEEQRRRFGWP
jgi:CYTH domain-containing protein